MIPQNLVKMTLTSEAVQKGLLLTLLLRKLDDNLYCLHLLRLSRITELLSPTCT